METIFKNMDLQAEGLWLAITIGIMLFLFIIFMPKKRLRWRELYITIGVVGYVTWISDSLFAGFLDLIDIGDPQKTGLAELISYSLIPSSLAAIYLNYLKETNKWMLVILFTIVSVLIEWSIMKVGLVTFKGWNIWYSIPIFILVFSYLLPLHLRFIKSK